MDKHEEAPMPALVEAACDSVRMTDDFVGRGSDVPSDFDFSYP